MTRLTDIKGLLQAGPELRLPRRGGSGRATTGGMVGVEIEADSIAVVEIRDGREVTKTAVAPLPPGAFADGEVLDPAAVTATLRGLWSEHGLSKQVRLGVANQRVVTRTMQLPAIEDPAQLQKAVRFQAEDQIPMPLDQAVLDHRVVGGSAGEEGGPQTIEVVVSAARREMIGAALKPLRDAGLDPVGVDLSAFALIRALGDPSRRPDEGSPAVPRLETVLYCNVGETSNLAIAQDRVCRFTRVSQAGLEGIVLFLVLFVITHWLLTLKRPGLTSGVFVTGYALSRIFVEFFREPDAQLGYLLGTDWLTMGMVLSLPMILLGLWAAIRAVRAVRADTIQRHPV